MSLSIPATEFIPTPAGKRPISESVVHCIPHGGRVAHVGNEIHLIDAEGNIIHKASRGESLPRAQEVSSTFARWKHTGSPPIQNFKATWTVPPNPTTDNGQTVVYFTAATSLDEDTFFEAMLQWGPSKVGGGPYWTVYSFFIGSGRVYFSHLVKVAVGASVEAVLNLTKHTDTSYDYTCGFSGIPESFITVNGVPNQVEPIVELQSNAISQPSDYPVGNTTFEKINITLTDSTYPPLNWTTVDDIADGLSTTVNVDGSHNGKVTVNHKAT